MKQLLLILLLVSTRLLAAAQQPACQAAHTGTYEMVTKSGTRTRITRTATQQTEQVLNSDEVTSYQVKWLDDCTYVLLPEESFFVKYPTAPRQAELKVRITGVSPRGYTAEISSNMFPGVLRGEAVRIP